MGFKNINENNNVKDIINQIKSNTDRLRKNPAQRIQNKTHIYCTFYNINLNETTVHDGSGDIREAIGEDSPVRYDKIIDCLMFGLNDWETNKENDEYEGFKINRENVSVIPSDTFDPVENSFLKLEIENETILYKVTSVERTKTENIPSYRIEFEAEYSDEDDAYHQIEKQVVNEYVFLHENIGTDKKVIIQNSKIEVLENLKVFINKLNDLYYTQYYDEQSKTLCLINGNTIYYSPFVVEFLKKSPTLNSGKYGNKLMLSHELSTDDNFLYQFQNSFYIKVLDGLELNENDFIFSNLNVSYDSIEYNFTGFSFYIDKTIQLIEKNKKVLDSYHELGNEDLIFKLSEFGTEDEVNLFIKTFIEENKVNWEILDLRSIFNNKSLDYMFKLPLVLYLCRAEYNNKIGKGLVGYNDMFNQKLL